MKDHLAEPEQGPVRERRQQILQAAMACFARRGFHQTTMHDIAGLAGISVGLIYRYFASKDDVISVMASEHKEDLREILDQARRAPNLFDALEILFTCHCDQQPEQVQATFVIDLFAESGRNPRVAALVEDVNEYFVAGVTELIAASSDAALLPPGIAPRRAAELIVDVMHGQMMRDVVSPAVLTTGVMQERQLGTLRSLFSLLFPAAPVPRDSE